jgi:hypothetical protein
MPLTAKGAEILARFQKEYGADLGQRYFYASKNAGTITGVDAQEDWRDRLDGILSGAQRLTGRLDALEKSRSSK